MDKQEILQMIVKQLQYYEMNGLASTVAETLDKPMEFQPANTLAELIKDASYKLDTMSVNGSTLSDNNNKDALDGDRDAGQQSAKVSASAVDLSTKYNEQQIKERLGECIIDLSKRPSTACKSPPLQMIFTTVHKSPVKTASFSIDGRYVATGSADCSIKVLDVEKMKIRSTIGDGGTEETKPTIRTLYEHTAEVNDVCFHPNTRILATASDDKTLRFYDLQKVTNKRAFRTYEDSFPVKSISFHPTGEYILAGTQHDSPVRMYNVITGQCFTSAIEDSEQHVGGVRMVRYNGDGRMYATCGFDGAVKIFDATNGRLIRHIQAAHGGHDVASVQFCKTSRYLLTSGKDSVPKVWDITSGKPAQVYIGATQKNVLIGASFSALTEDYVLSGCEKTNTLVAWCSRTGQVVDKFSTHGGAINSVVSSVADTGVLTCGEDNKGRYWSMDDIKKYDQQ
ncbi:hypothetical protein MIR68_010833 [Amoeboaphelidium protococcarum]|nr:hypothetical protein MIR68_010833 [Amoeboaphelidium protococcarum]